MDIQFDFKLNYILYIESLKEKEVNSSNNLFQKTIVPYANSNSIRCERFNVSDKKSLLNCLSRILECKSEVYPLIHFAMHGTKEGIKLNPNNDKITTWSELADMISKINIKSKNRLLLVFATCFGGYGLRLNSETDRAPFYMLVGPSKKAKGYRLDIVLLKSFYDEFFKSFNFLNAKDYVNETIGNVGVTLEVVTSVEIFLNFQKLNRESIKSGKTRHNLIKQMKSEFGPKLPYEIKSKVMYNEQIEELSKEQMKDYKRHYFMCDLYSENEKRFEFIK